MIYRVKELRKVYIHNPVVPVIHHLQCFQDCLLCASVWSESVAMVVELLFKYRTEYLCCRLLNKTVNHCWHPKVSYPSIWFRYLHPAYWLRLILSRPHLFPDILAVFRKVWTQFFNGHSVYTGCSFVPDDLQICLIKVFFTQYLLHKTTCVHALFPFCPFCLCRL